MACEVAGIEMQINNEFRPDKANFKLVKNFNNVHMQTN